MINLDLILDFTTKEVIKEKIKGDILKKYKEFLNGEENLNFNFLNEEEFRNYLEIL